MYLKSLKVLFLAIFILVAGCLDDDDKDDKKKGSDEVKLSSQEKKSLDLYSGKWRYVDDGKEFNISKKNINEIYFLQQGESSASDAPEEFTNRNHYIFLASDTNLLEQKRKNDTSKYLVRDGIKDTKVKGKIEQPQDTVSKASLDSSQVFISNVSGIGNLDTVLKNIKTDDLITIRSDANGNISSNSIPTGEYEVSISSDKGEVFEDELEVTGAETNLGVLNITDVNSLNYKVTAEVNSGLFQSKTSRRGSTTTRSSNDLSYDYYRGQYVFPLIELEDQKNKKTDLFWVTVKVKNISNKIASAVQLEILCNENADWLVDCGGDEAGNLFKNWGTMRSKKEENYSFWLQVRPFNSEAKDIVIPMRVSTADGVVVNDEIVLKAYKKPHTVKVALAENNSGYIFLPGRESIRMNGSSAYINLPFINNHAYQLLYANDNSRRQANYSIANGFTIPTLSSKDLGESKLDWNLRYESENNSEQTAPSIKHGEVLNAYLHEGDLDFYKIVTQDEITITAADDKSKAVLADETVDANTKLKFNAKIIDEKVSKSLIWEQVSGSKIDISKGENGESLELTTPIRDQKETFTFKVSFKDDIESEDGSNSKDSFDYLSITVNGYDDSKVMVTDDDKVVSLGKLEPTNLILNYSNKENASNEFVVDDVTNLDSLTIQAGVTLVVKNDLTIKNKFDFNGAVVKVEHGNILDLTGVSDPIIPRDGTLVLDGELKLGSNSDLTVRGTVTHSLVDISKNSSDVTLDDINARVQNINLTLNVPGKLIVEKSGKIDVSEKGLAGGVTGRNDKYNPLVYGLDTNSSKVVVVGKEFIESGGSHGGLGGNASIEGNTYNRVYGVIQKPTTLGLGGVSVLGLGSVYRIGGGAIHIKAGELILEGEILAEGGSAESTSWDNSSGAGGSILIELHQPGTGVLKSTGLISIKGGTSDKEQGYHGGGGRLAIHGINKSVSSYNQVDWQGFGNSQDEQYAPNNGTIYIAP